MEYTIIEAEPPRAPRRYLKLEEYKDFVLNMHKAGVRQKDIITALKRQSGLDVKPHNLKWFLNKWGVSHKKLTKKRQLHIRQAVDKWRQSNKSDPIVKFERSGRVLSKEEIDIIESHTPGYFRGIKASPGDIELLEATGGLGNGNNDGSESESAEVEVDTRSTSMNNVPKEFLDLIDYSPEDVDIDNAAQEPGAVAAEDHTENCDSDVNMHDTHDMIDETSDHRHFKEMYTVDLDYLITDESQADDQSEEDYYSISEPEDMELFPENDDQGKNPMAEVDIDEDEDRQDIQKPKIAVEELEKIITDGIKTLGIGNEQGGYPVGVDEPLGSNTDMGAADKAQRLFQGSNLELDMQGDIDSPLAKYTRKYEYRFQHWIKGWRIAANIILREIEIRREDGMSFEQATSTVLQESETLDRHAFPYEVCMNIKYGKKKPPDSEKSSAPDGNTEEEKIGRFAEEAFELLVDWVESESCVDEIIFDQFCELVVHLSRVVREYGYLSFFTACALQDTYRLLLYSDTEGAQNLLCWAATESIRIFERIEMGYSKLSWRSEYLYLEDCQERDDLLRRLRYKYGPCHPVILEIDLQTAVAMIGEQNATDPSHRMVEKLVSETLNKIERTRFQYDQVGMAHLSDGFLLLGFALDTITKETRWRNKVLKRLANSIFLLAQKSQVGAWIKTKISCALANIQAHTNELALSLTTLFTAYGTFRLVSNPWYASMTLQRILTILNSYGPVLCPSLEPILVDFRTQTKVPENRYSKDYPKLLKIWRQGKDSYNRRLLIENCNIPAVQSTNRSKTPDFNDYLYTQSWRNWAWGQGIDDFPNELDLEDRITELED
ncbi:hypothetical protein TWF694_005011 [Orbilia ellipsospora]|uniref:Clr5 domain-containing protein n=1 Tax=Orbilia ellipsospora TaxID=2528407 RepID=A0AAV9WVC0_9PEZI